MLGVLRTRSYVRIITTLAITSTFTTKVTVNSNPMTINATRFELMITVILEYKVIHGDLYVHSSYIVPADDTRFSKSSYGLKLGNLVRSIRNSNYYKEYKEELLVMGFDYNKQMRDFEMVRTALLAYKSINNDLLVPLDFVIPSNDPQYPQEVWGMKLGFAVSGIRTIDSYAKHKEELLAI